MGKILYDQSRLLAPATCGERAVEDLPTDALLALLPEREVAGDSLADSIVESHRGWRPSKDVARPLARVEGCVSVFGDVDRLAGLVQSVLREQARSKARAMAASVCSALVAHRAPDFAPAGLAALAAESPNGVGVPARGEGAPLAPADLDALLEKVPARPHSGRRFLVMHPRLLARLRAAARSGGRPLEEREDERAGRVTPRFAGVGVVPCARISLHETAPRRTSVYLIRVASERAVGESTEGVARAHPRGRSAIRASAVETSPDDPDGLAVRVEWDVAFESGPPDSVARLMGVGMG